MTDRQLILASGSPRRRQILADAGLEFSIAEHYHVKESWPAEMPAEQVAEYLAALKSDAYPKLLGNNDILLTADTTVVLDNELLGKPHDTQEAKRMLRKLSGRVHKVITGVVLRTGRDGSGLEKRESFSAETLVWFRQLTPQEIDYYVDTFQPLDKAGAYGIQEWIGYVGISRIEGSFYNVMGLPIQMIYTKLNDL